MSTVSSEGGEEQAISAEELEALLAEKLQELREAQAPKLETFLPIFNLLKDKKNTRALFKSMNGLEVVINASKRASSDSIVQRFVGRIFLLLVTAGENVEYFMEKGGLDYSWELMATNISDNEILSNLSMALAEVMDALSNEQRAEIAEATAETLLPIMELRTKNGLAFTYCTLVLHPLLDPGVELSPALSDRITKCTLEGLVLHKHSEDAQVMGRRLLNATVGEEVTKEMLLDIPTDGPFVSHDVMSAFHASVLAIGSHFHDEAMQGMETVFRLVSDENNNSEAFYGLMISLNAIEAILEATKCHAANTYFLHRAGGVFVRFLDVNHDRSLLFLKNGGFERSMEIVQSDETDAFIVISYIGVLTFMLYNLSEEERATISMSSFMTALGVMLAYKEDANVFAHACAFLGATLGSWLEGNTTLFVGAVQCAYDGILKHKDSEDAQQNGRMLLTSLVGADTAREMIEHAEMHHREGCTCSCAA